MSLQLRSANKRSIDNSIFFFLLYFQEKEHFVQENILKMETGHSSQFSKGKNTLFWGFLAGKLGKKTRFWIGNTSPKRNLFAKTITDRTNGPLVLHCLDNSDNLLECFYYQVTSLEKVN